MYPCVIILYNVEKTFLSLLFTKAETKAETIINESDNDFVFESIYTTVISNV